MYMTVENFSDWVRDARVGERFCYYTGLLMRDRNLHTPGTEKPLGLQLAQRAWGYHLMGRVVLFQKRVSDGVCMYYAEKVA